MKYWNIQATNIYEHKILDGARFFRFWCASFRHACRIKFQHTKLIEAYLNKYIRQFECQQELMHDAVVIADAGLIWHIQMLDENNKIINSPSRLALCAIDCCKFAIVMDSQRATLIVCLRSQMTVCKARVAPRRAWRQYRHKFAKQKLSRGSTWKFFASCGMSRALFGRLFFAYPSIFHAAIRCRKLFAKQSHIHAKRNKLVWKRFEDHLNYFANAWITNAQLTSQQLISVRSLCASHHTRHTRRKANRAPQKTASRCVIVWVSVERGFVRNSLAGKFMS